MRPLAAVHLTLTLPGGDAQELQELGEFSPSGNDMGSSTEVYVPAATQAGSSTVSDDQHNPATYKFKVGQ